MGLASASLSRFCRVHAKPAWQHRGGSLHEVPQSLHSPAMTAIRFAGQEKFEGFLDLIRDFLAVRAMF